MQRHSRSRLTVAAHRHELYHAPTHDRPRHADRPRRRPAANPTPPSPWSAAGWGGWPPPRPSPPAAIKSRCSTRTNGSGARPPNIRTAATGSTWGRRSSPCRRSSNGFSAEAGKDLADYCEIVPLDPQWRCFFDERAGGGVLDLTADQDAMKANLDDFTGAENTSAGYAAFLEYAKRLNGVSDRFFFYKNVGGIRDTLKLGGMFNLETLSDLRALKMGKSVARNGAGAPSPTAGSPRWSTTTPSTSAAPRTSRRRCCAASRTSRRPTASGIRSAGPGPCRKP